MAAGEHIIGPEQIFPEVVVRELGEAVLLAEQNSQANSDLTHAREQRELELAAVRQKWDTRSSELRVRVGASQSAVDARWDRISANSLDDFVEGNISEEEFVYISGLLSWKINSGDKVKTFDPKRAADELMLFQKLIPGAKLLEWRGVEDEAVNVTVVRGGVLAAKAKAVINQADYILSPGAAYALEFEDQTLHLTHQRLDNKIAVNDEVEPIIRTWVQEKLAYISGSLYSDRAFQLFVSELANIAALGSAVVGLDDLKNYLEMKLPEYLGQYTKHSAKQLLGKVMNIGGEKMLAAVGRKYIEAIGAEAETEMIEYAAYALAPDYETRADGPEIIIKASRLLAGKEA